MSTLCTATSERDGLVTLCAGAAYHAVLSAALHKAVRWGLLERSPALKRRPRQFQLPSRLALHLTKSGSSSSLPGPTTHSSPRFFVAASTGCRRGELCGLRWSDVDLETAEVVIRRAISDVPGQLEVRTTKTGRIRRMAIDPATVAILQTQRRRRTLQRRGELLAQGRCLLWSQSPDHCEPWRPGRVTAAFIRVREEAGLSSIRLHHLRHFSASVMLAGGVDVRTTAGRLGRSQPAVTLKTYALYLAGVDRDAAKNCCDCTWPRLLQSEHRPCRVTPDRESAQRRQLDVLISLLACSG